MKQATQKSKEKKRKTKLVVTFFVVIASVGACLNASEVLAGPMATLEFGRSTGTAGAGATNTTQVTTTPLPGEGVGFAAGGDQEAKDAFGTPGQFEITLFPFQETETNFFIKVTSTLNVPLPDGPLQIEDRFFFFNGTIGTNVNNTPGTVTGTGVRAESVEDSNGIRWAMTDVSFIGSVGGPPDHIIFIPEFGSVKIEKLDSAVAPELPLGATSLVLALLGFGVLAIRKKFSK